MPELPEVETVRRDLTGSLLGLSIQEVRIIDARVIRDQAPATFCSQLKNKKIVEVSRRGKALVITLDKGASLVVQLMMTGQLVHMKTIPDVLAKETKVIFTLSNGSSLLYNDQRLFGRLTLVDDVHQFKHFLHLGPEPFSAEFNTDYIRDVFHNKSVAVKKVLLDHGFVAGIGNIYASEILFRCGIDPQRMAKSLDSKEIKRLQKMIVEVLTEAIKFRGSSMRNYRDGQGEKGRFNERIRVYAKENQPCPKCGQLIVRIVQGGRSTFFCKQCQR